MARWLRFRGNQRDSGHPLKATGHLAAIGPFAKGWRAQGVAGDRSAQAAELGVLGNKTLLANRVFFGS